jgi:hypothetical protein
LPRRRAPSDELPPRVPPTTRAARLPDRPFSKGRPRTPLFAVINSGFCRHGFLLALRNSERAEIRSQSRLLPAIFRTIITSVLNCQIRRQGHVSAPPARATNGSSPSSSPLEKLLAVLTDGWTGDAEEYENSTIQSHDVLIGKPAHIAADSRLSNRRDFVRHSAAGSAQSVASLGLIGRRSNGASTGSR